VPGPRIAILHVEDDPSLQNLVRITLEQLGGYAVRTAVNGYLALDLARQAPPDLLLLDLDLPGMNGIATLRALRQIDGLGGVPAVFLTAAVDPQIDAELRSLGVQEVLAKPFRPRLLVQALGRVLGRAED
jgi:two-component system, OmpR family, response regulator